MKRVFLTVFTVTVLSVCYMVGTAESRAVAPAGTLTPALSLAPVVFTAPTVAPIVFRHGDCSWLPEMALSAGWEQKHIPRLMHIAARESGCCPNRIGGSVVDSNCKFIKMSTMTHPSDAGTLQINGINYDPKRNKYAPICTQMKICTQEPLLDAFTNLKAGKLLFDVTGQDWSPWIIPEGGW